MTTEATMPVVMCPDEECCGTLVERVVGAPMCNECGRYYTLKPMSDRAVARMLRIISKGRRGRELREAAKR